MRAPPQTPPLTRYLLNHRFPGPNSLYSQDARLQIGINIDMEVVDIRVY
jgi:hypothetical protein